LENGKIQKVFKKLTRKNVLVLNLSVKKEIQKQRKLKARQLLEKDGKIPLVKGVD